MQHGRAEKVLLAQLQHPVHRQQSLWLTEQLYHCYHHALQTGGEVSLGKDLVLYQSLERKLRGELTTRDHNHRWNLISLLCQVYRTAHGKKLKPVAHDLKAFAFKQLPEILKQQTNNYTTVVSTVASTVHDVASPRDGIAFLLERIENEPGWLRFNNQDGWQMHAYSLAEWRTQVKDLGDLEPRLLKVVATELRRDLKTRTRRHVVMYYQNHNYFWPEKDDAFAKVAEESLAPQQEPCPSLTYITTYPSWVPSPNQPTID